jgi:hypothetical protein
MALRTSGGEQRTLDPFAVVRHQESKVLALVSQFDSDASCLRMPERIPECFGGDVVDLVPDDRMQISRLTVDGDAEGDAGGCW